MSFCIDAGHRVLERLAVEISHDGHAGGLRLLARLLFEVFPFIAHEQVRLLRRVAKEFPVIGRQTLPGLFRHHQHFRAHGVLGERVVAGEFIMIGGDKGWPVVLRAVDQPCRKTGDDLSIGKLDGFRSQRLDHIRH